MLKPILNILVGISGSGKSTYAEMQYDYETVSSDRIREELFNDVNCQEHNDRVFYEMQKRAINYLNEGKNVIYDATNITRKSRKSIIDYCKKNCPISCIKCTVVWSQINTCVERDSKRERSVGISVIKKMLSKFQAPFYDEGFNRINVEFMDDCNYSKNSYLEHIQHEMKIPHNNNHHALDILAHCTAAFLYCKKEGCDRELLEAAMYHDIGKPYVKSFINSKGELTEEAHYYQHQNYGAWMAYGLPVDNIIYVAWLIGTHMDPFLETKYYKNLPLFLKKDIDLLHEADLQAH